MDIANYFSVNIGVSTQEHFERMHPVMDKNCASYRHVKINTELLVSALKKDKKNSATQLRLILPDQNGKISIGLYDSNKALTDTINEYFSKYNKVT
jgi:3-dehydroquinate synthetase